MARRTRGLLVSAAHAKPSVPSTDKSCVFLRLRSCTSPVVGAASAGRQAGRTALAISPLLGLVH